MQVGAGLAGGAAVLGLAAVGALIAAAILGLATVVTAWLAALIVAVVVGGVAGVLGWVGVRRMRHTASPLPVETLDSVKEDMEWLKTSAKSGMK
jgi:hypothetical protein